MTIDELDAILAKDRRKTNWILGSVFAITVALILIPTHSRGATPASPASVAAALAKRLPKTQVGSIDCKKLPGVCEVAAGSTLFYTDPAARYLIIGRVYDMETRTDLTAARLLELNPDLLVNGAARQPGTEGPVGGNGQAGIQQARPAAVRNVPLDALPAKGAIAWGPASGPKVTVFSDFRCSYCSQLSSTLRQIGARVEERPISVLGSRKLSEAVYCSKSQVSALHAAYAGETPQSPKCDTSGLDANEAFARSHGFNGTPVLVRADGAVLEGFRPAPVLTAWLKGEPAA